VEYHSDVKQLGAQTIAGDDALVRAKEVHPQCSVSTDHLESDNDGTAKELMEWIDA
jgi:hypothetical protein